MFAKQWIFHLPETEPVVFTGSEVLEILFKEISDELLRSAGRMKISMKKTILLLLSTQ